MRTDINRYKGEIWIHLAYEHAYAYVKLDTRSVESFLSFTLEKGIKQSSRKINLSLKKLNQYFYLRSEYFNTLNLIFFFKRGDLIKIKKNRFLFKIIQLSNLSRIRGRLTVL